MKAVLSPILAALLLVQPALGAERIVLVRAHAATEIELQQFLLVNPGYRALTDYLRLKVQHAPERRELLAAFEAAQRDFLAASMEQAKASFQKVVARRLDLSWPESDRRVLHQAMLRLAQIDGKHESEWLSAAARFAPDLKPDPRLFPPPLVKRAAVAASMVARQSLTWRPTFAHGVALILVDGRAYEGGRELAITLTPGDHLVEVQTNFSIPEKFVGNHQDVIRYTFAPRPIAGGTCASPSWQNNIDTGSNLAAFYSVNCVVKPGFDGWRNLTQTAKAPGMVITDETKSLVLPRSPEIQEKKTSPWLWWALAGLATAGAFAIYEHNRPRPDARVEPTHESNLRR